MLTGSKTSIKLFSSRIKIATAVKVFEVEAKSNIVSCSIGSLCETKRPSIKSTSCLKPHKTVSLVLNVPKSSKTPGVIHNFL